MTEFPWDEYRELRSKLKAPNTMTKQELMRYHVLWFYLNGSYGKLVTPCDNLSHPTPLDGNPKGD